MEQTGKLQAKGAENCQLYDFPRGVPKFWISSIGPFESSALPQLQCQGPTGKLKLAHTPGVARTKGCGMLKVSQVPEQVHQWFTNVAHKHKHTMLGRKAAYALH